MMAMPASTVLDESPAGLPAPPTTAYPASPGSVPSGQPSPGTPSAAFEGLFDNGPAAVEKLDSVFNGGTLGTDVSTTAKSAEKGLDELMKDVLMAKQTASVGEPSALELNFKKASWFPSLHLFGCPGTPLQPATLPPPDRTCTVGTPPAELV